MPRPSLSRRRFVATVGSIGLAFLAGCADDGDEPPEEAEEPGDETGASEEGAADESEPADGTEEIHELAVYVETEAGEPAVGAFVIVEADEGRSPTTAQNSPQTTRAVRTSPSGMASTPIEVDAGEAEVGSGEAKETVTIDGSDEEITISVESEDNGTGTGGEPGANEDG